MTGSTTSRMVSVYEQMAAPTSYFSEMFQSPPSNFFNSEQVEFDIIRSDEEIAIVITDLSTGYRVNEEDLYTNKSFVPPIFKEKIGINAFDLLDRMAGDTPFDDPEFRANVLARSFRAIRTIEAKIRRSIELQASQVLQTGTITLIDENGTPRYTVDFKPKATHFPTAGVSWATATFEQKYADLQNLAEVIRNDGLSDPDSFDMGIDAYNNLILDDGFQNILDNRRIDIGSVGRMRRNANGGNFRGVIEVGNYSFDLWTYGGRYNDPQTGVKTQFMEGGKIICRSSDMRMDAFFGAIPNFNNIFGNNRSVPLNLPNRISNAGGGMDMFTNLWTPADGEQLFAGIGSRPLMVPTAIDQYGCLDTQL